MSSPAQNRVHRLAALPDGRSGLGAQLFPEYTSPQEWEAAGSKVSDESYDVVAISGYRGQPDVNEHAYYWAVQPQNETEQPAERFEVPRGPLTLPPREGSETFADIQLENYGALAEEVSQHLGRTGLTIAVL